ncbi:GreA/GreB family elongation factor [Algoriphagus aestuariicola]|jgi:regulator of nucleoside diphosphate kinase|uniref:GreA/GreB family elongation factor n=1 Tax=Algoriphagus aestuariicola TaxID=1852016 RepID=A0ABS3BKE9_9BACT|nr:GreA/GreB family elongation factor [Algoriphagus aestuariicola]MBN7799643.1 GreA/GreB family elongation factor [Algoriphagus aestuariicola]
MKPIISNTDYRAIYSLIQDLPASQRTKEMGQMQNEIESATKVPDGGLEAGIIRINSYFEVMDLDSGKTFQLRLVMPKMANLAEQKISILSPLGVALIGFGEGMLVDWVLPGGPKRLKILKVDNSPQVSKF